MSDRVVLITGAGHGVGLACARQFADEGARLILCDKDDMAGRTAMEELKAGAKEARFLRTDMANPLDVRNAVALAEEEFGRIDVVVGSAAAAAPGDFLDLSDEDFDHVVKVNLSGAFHLTQRAGRAMKRQIEEERAKDDARRRHYAIIHVASVNAMVTSGRDAAYSASKAGVIQLARAAAAALGPLGIRVNAVAPAAVNTDFLDKLLDDPSARKRLLKRTPLARIAEPSEVASVVKFLASPDAGYITGQCIIVDGGGLAYDAAAAPIGG